jgi:hypothetical protein
MIAASFAARVWCRFLCSCGCGQRCACNCAAQPAYRKLADDRRPVAHDVSAGKPFAAHHPAPDCVTCAIDGCVLALGHDRKLPHRTAHQ